MSDHHPSSTALPAARRLIQRVLEGGIPTGEDYDACRLLLQSGARGPEAFHALCVLLEGALADPGLDIGEAQIVVPLLKNLARGTVGVEDLL